jgi:hypothetical protein
MTVQGQSEPKGAAKYNRFRAGIAGKQTRNQCMMFRNSWQGSAKAVLHLSRFSAGLPLLIPTDRAVPSYQPLVLSLASLAFVLFVAVTDVLTFGARTEVRSFLDINIRPPLDKRTPAFFAMANVTRKVPVAVEFSRKGLASNRFSGE